MASPHRADYNEDYTFSKYELEAFRDPSRDCKNLPPMVATPRAMRTQSMETLPGFKRRTSPLPASFTALHEDDESSSEREREGASSLDVLPCKAQFTS